MPFSQKTLINKIKHFDAVVNKSLFIFKERIISSFRFKPGLKMLFSVKPVWEKSIRVGFHGTPHKLTFNDFSEQNIRENDQVVALTMPDLIYLSQLRSELTHFPIPIPSLEAIDICDDKYLFDQTLRAKGFGAYLPKIGSDLAYPYILKKKISEYGANCFIISDMEAESPVKHLVADPEYFCQQIIEGTTEYATHIIYKEGKIVASLNIKYVFDTKVAIKGQNEFLYRKICSCPYLDIFADMLKSIGFEGLCCVNYKVLDGQPSVLEINPRFGGSLSAFFFSFIRHL